jgi:glycosyltransferase involved in cell wall biosynthesis
MNVLFLAHSYPRSPADPVGSFVLRLAVALRAQGITVHVLAPAAPGVPARAEYEGIPVERFRYAPARLETLAYSGTMRDQVRASWVAKATLASLVGAQFWSAARRRGAFHPALVHAHWWFPGGLVGSWLKRWWKVPLVITMHGSDIRLARDSKVGGRLLRSVLARTDRVTTVSSWLAAQTEAIVPAVHPIVAPMPIQPDLFHPGGGRAPDTLLFVGKLNLQKGFGHLLHALARMRARPTVEVVVGVGSAPADAQALAESLGVADRLRWYPLLPQAELADRYRACTALVMPAQEEGLGLVAAEALLCETPVVAFASGGITDLIDDGRTGRLVPPGDTTALAAALDDLLARPDRGAALGVAGRRAMLDTFSPDVVARRYAAIYQEALATREA